LIVQHKAWWVVKEFEQQFEIDYKEIFMIIVKFMIYKIIFVIVMYYNYELKQMNIKMIFLNSTLKEIIYVVQLTKYEKKKEKMYRLKKVLYELKQSSWQWYEMIHCFLTEFRYTSLHTDNSVF